MSVSLVPWFTRHTRGTIEAERDDRLSTRVRRVRLQDRWPGIAHPRLLGALAAKPRDVRPVPAPVDLSAWVDDGGWFDPNEVARLRIGDRAMKRCNA